MDIKTAYGFSLCLFILAAVGVIIAANSPCNDAPFHEMPFVPFPTLLIFMSLCQGFLTLPIGLPIAAVAPLFITVDSATGTLLWVSLLHGDPLCDDIHVYRMLVVFLFCCLIRWIIFAVIIIIKLAPKEFREESNLSGEQKKTEPFLVSP